MSNKIGALEVHKLAGLVPMMDDTELISLQESIRTGEQEVPIILYRGKIVDGRCRATACHNLGVPVKFEELPQNLSLKEVAEKVVRLNVRRNQTSTQRAITAFRQWKADTTLTRQILYTTWGITNRLFQAAEELDGLNPGWLEALFNKQKIKVGAPFKDSYGKEKRKTSSSLPVVRDWAMKLKFEASKHVIAQPDKLTDSTHQEVINALHPDVRVKYYENIRRLNISEVKINKGVEIIEADKHAMEELALSEAQHSIKISIAQP